MSRLLLLIFLISAIPLRAEDSPQGFASIEAHGRNGTSGGAGGEVVDIHSLADLIEHAASDKKLILHIHGKIEATKGREIRIASHKSIIGIGGHAELVGPELQLIGVENVIIRNLTIRDSYVEGDPSGKSQDNDGIQIDASHHIWIDHCAIRRMGDGLIDLRKGTDCVTVSWCILSDQNKAIGVGWTDQTDFRITLHHNWIHHTNQRNPAFDNGIGHFYNNYFQNLTACGVDARGKSSVAVENCVFESVRNPLRRKPEAQLVSRGNQFEQCHGDNQPAGSAFDPKAFYRYQLDPTETLPELIKKHAGPQIQ